MLEASTECPRGSMRHCRHSIDVFDLETPCTCMETPCMMSCCLKVLLLFQDKHLRLSCGVPRAEHPYSSAPCRTAAGASASSEATAWYLLPGALWCWELCTPSKVYADQQAQTRSPRHAMIRASWRTDKPAWSMATPAHRPPALSQTCAGCTVSCCAERPAREAQGRRTQVVGVGAGPDCAAAHISPARLHWLSRDEPLNKQSS